MWCVMYYMKDQLPLSNAVAQVEFWEIDLKQSEEYLKYVKTFEKYNLPNWSETNKKALKDVQVSLEGLKLARFKLGESEKLE